MLTVGAIAEFVVTVAVVFEFVAAGLLLYRAFR
jgi:hypothetical protein